MKREQTTLKEQLLLQRFPAVNKLGAEGSDHINIDFSSKTTLGAMLTSSSRKYGLSHPVFGDFISIDAFELWCRDLDHDDDLRTVKGKSVSKKFSELDNAGTSLPDALLIDAYYYKILSNPEILKEVKSTTPVVFDYYRTNEAGLRIRSRYGKKHIPAVTEAVRAVRENTTPVHGVNMEVLYASYLPN